MLKHGGSQISSDFSSVCAEVSEHGAGFPATNELDGLRILVGTQESGGTSRAQTVGCDLMGRDAGGREGSCSSFVEPVGDVGSGGIFVGVGSGVANPVERGFGWSPMATQVRGAPTKSSARIEDSVRVGGMTEGFTTHAILLVSACESYMDS